MAGDNSHPKVRLVETEVFVREDLGETEKTRHGSLVNDRQRLEVGDANVFVDFVDRVIERPELDDLSRQRRQESSI
jgi:hypothetical protein